MLAGVFAGDALGRLIGVQANVGGLAARDAPDRAGANARLQARGLAAVVRPDPDGSPGSLYFRL
jgi:hypothetical protein